MKLFVLTVLILPAICLAKTATMDDMFAQVLAMKMSGTKNTAAAEYTYDSSKGAVFSILELIKEMMGDKKDDMAKKLKDIADADLKVAAEEAKMRLARVAQTNAQGILDDAKEALNLAKGEEGKAQTAAQTLKDAQPAEEEAAKKANTALANIVSFLCQNTTEATKDICAELDPSSDTAAVTPPAKEFYVGGKKKRCKYLRDTDCKAMIDNKEDCIAAVAMFSDGTKWNSERQMGGYQQGCLRIGKAVYYNTMITSSAQAGAEPICLCPN